MHDELYLKAIKNIPMILPGDDLSEIILVAAKASSWTWQDDDIIVIAQKIVSKAEGRFVALNDVTPSEKALVYEKQTGKDPRLIELILRESRKVLRTRKGLMIVEHNLGFICANAGIDQSNIKNFNGNPTVLLLPKNPDQSAVNIRKNIGKAVNKKIGVVIIDSHGRPWRKGIVGITIGLSNVPGVLDRRGSEDLFGYKLRITEIGTADEIAAAASILMGQGNEGNPVVIVRGYPYKLSSGSIKQIVRSESEDLFR